MSLPPLDVVLPLLVILIVSLSIHEAAHAWTADRLGDPTARMLGRLTLNPLSHIDWIGTVLFPLIAISSGVPLLGWAKPVPVNLHNLRAPRRDFALVALAGPVSNLMLATAGAIVLKTFFGVGLETPGVASALINFVWPFIQMNVLLAVFNMIPVPPLDGGNVLAGFAPEPVARLVDITRPYGFLVLYVLLFTGVLHDIIGPVGRAIEDWLL